MPDARKSLIEAENFLSAATAHMRRGNPAETRSASGWAEQNGVGLAFAWGIRTEGLVLKDTTVMIAM